MKNSHILHLPVSTAAMAIVFDSKCGTRLCAKSDQVPRLSQRAPCLRILSPEIMLLRHLGIASHHMLVWMVKELNMAPHGLEPNKEPYHLSTTCKDDIRSKSSALTSTAVSNLLRDV